MEFLADSFKEAAIFLGLFQVKTPPLFCRKSQPGGLTF